MGNHWSKGVTVLSLMTLPNLKNFLNLYTASRIESLIDLNAMQILVMMFALFFQK